MCEMHVRGVCGRRLGSRSCLKPQTEKNIRQDQSSSILVSTIDSLHVDPPSLSDTYLSPPVDTLVCILGPRCLLSAYPLVT